MVKKKIAAIFFILGLVFALPSLLQSAAISQGSMERSAYAKVAKDQNALLRLDGFDGSKTYNPNSPYTKVGSIMNNTNQSIILKVTVKPDFSSVKNKNYQMGIMIGTITCEFNSESGTSQQITMTLLPNQSVDVQAYLKKNQSSYVTTSFDFAVTNDTGTYQMMLSDTPNTPRRIICR